MYDNSLHIPAFTANESGYNVHFSMQSDASAIFPRDLEICFVYTGRFLGKGDKSVLEKKARQLCVGTGAALGHIEELSLHYKFSIEKEEYGTYEKASLKGKLAEVMRKYYSVKAAVERSSIAAAGTATECLSSDVASDDAAAAPKIAAASVATTPTMYQPAPPLQSHSTVAPACYPPHPDSDPFARQPKPMQRDGKPAYDAQPTYTAQILTDSPTSPVGEQRATGGEPMSWSRTDAAATGAGGVSEPPASRSSSQVAVYLTVAPQQALPKPETRDFCMDATHRTAAVETQSMDMPRIALLMEALRAEGTRVEAKLELLAKMADEFKSVAQPIGRNPADRSAILYFLNQHPELSTWLGVNRTKTIVRQYPVVIPAVYGIRSYSVNRHTLRVSVALHDWLGKRAVLGELASGIERRARELCPPDTKTDTYSVSVNVETLTKPNAATVRATADLCFVVAPLFGRLMPEEQGDKMAAAKAQTRWQDNAVYVVVHLKNKAVVDPTMPAGILPDSGVNLSVGGAPAVLEMNVFDDRILTSGHWEPITAMLRDVIAVRELQSVRVEQCEERFVETPERTEMREHSCDVEVDEHDKPLHPLPPLPGQSQSQPVSQPQSYSHSPYRAGATGASMDYDYEQPREARYAGMEHDSWARDARLQMPRMSPSHPYASPAGSYPQSPAHGSDSVYGAGGLQGSGSRPPARPAPSSYDILGRSAGVQHRSRW